MSNFVFFVNGDFSFYVIMILNEKRNILLQVRNVLFMGVGCLVYICVC